MDEDTEMKKQEAALRTIPAWLDFLIGVIKDESRYRDEAGLNRSALILIDGFFDCESPEHLKGGLVSYKAAIPEELLQIHGYFTNGNPVPDVYFETLASVLKPGLEGIGKVRIARKEPLKRFIIFGA